MQSNSRFAPNTNVALAGTFGKRERSVYIDLNTYEVEEIDHQRERELRSLRSLMHQRHSFAG